MYGLAVAPTRALENDVFKFMLFCFDSKSISI